MLQSVDSSLDVLCESLNIVPYPVRSEEVKYFRERSYLLICFIETTLTHFSLSLPRSLRSQSRCDVVLWDA